MHLQVKTSLAAPVTALCLLYTAPAAEATKYCGVERGHGGPTPCKSSGAVSCHAARAVLRRYATSKAPCEGSSCVRRQRR